MEAVTMMFLRGLGVPIIEYPLLAASLVKEMPQIPTKRGSGKATVKDVTFTHYTDKASTGLYGLGAGLDITTGVVGLLVLGLGALGVSRLLKRSRKRRRR